MKLTDFGLWFYFYQDSADREWSTTIHQQGSAFIFYDGVDLGYQYLDFDLIIYNKKPQRIKLKKDFPREHDLRYRIGRPLTMDDFEIIPNPDYRGDP